MKLITFLILISMNAYSAIDNYTLQGKGMYEWMWLDVYEASLYRVNNSKKLEANNLYQHDFILELNY